ncbi:hypothetical protein CRG98_005477 [Punica granatum]|uniref:Integrase catalytic domain-containing protein n=1 Tax=Punica granatum TaxID=22663 RepID=A0A2I0L0A6_PUNGR|nr:hypothetical protein CRG98_005477 [Punica granatum]
MGITRLGRLYENSATTDKGKAPATEVEAMPRAPSTPPKNVTEEEAEAFMKILKASEYKVVEQMAKSPAHISLLALLLNSKPHREAFLRVLTAAQVPKGTPPDRIEETINSIFSNTISFSNDELPSEGCAHSRALHIVCKLNRGTPVPPLSHFFPGPPLIIGSTSDGPSSDFDDTPDALPTVYAVTKEIPLGVHIRPAQENEELNNWTSVLRFSAVIANVELWLHSNPNFRHDDSNPPEECLGEPRPIYFGEGLDEDSLVPEMEESLPRLEDRQLTSLEPIEEINVGTEEEPRTLKIGTSLDPTQRARMIDFLTSIKEEVVKQINAGFLEVCNYSEWVANIVPVEKKDGRVRVCIDYRDLNKASPKDNFPLPHIDILVDNTARHAQFSFMDGFFGYNQIRMAEEDKIKTTFTTMWGTFCYRVMPFGLKNAGATYQRAMVTLFHDMMHKEVEVYVDDMIAKSKEGEDHLANLKRLFDSLKEYKLRLNPAKCTFGTRLGKLLGFVVSERGIEVDPDKVNAIKELPPPSSVLEVRGFLGRLNYIRLRQYTLYHTIRLLSKAEPFKYLLDSPSSMRNLAKWRCQLTEYDIEYVSRTSVKGQAIADHLAEFPIEDSTPINPNFPDEGILQVDDEGEKPGWKMYFDGAVNFAGSGIGAVLISPDGRYYPIKAPPNELRPMTAPWPFSMWGMDVISPINPKASSGHMFILVAIDYFTKWIEAITLASVTVKAVARFLRRNVIAWYGVPATIITDNAKNLNNKVENLFEAA